MGHISVVVLIFCATADSRHKMPLGCFSTGLSPAKSAAISAPRPALVIRCSAVSANSQLCAQLPAHLRRYCGNRRAASILSSKVLTVLRVLPRRETAAVRPGDPSRTGAVVFCNLSPQPHLSNRPSSGRAEQPSGARRAATADRLTPLKLTRDPVGRRNRSPTLPRASLCSELYFTLNVDQGATPRHLAQNFEPKRLLDCKRGRQPR